MIRKYRVITLFALLFCALAQTAFTQTGGDAFSIDKSPLPKPNSPVVDLAGVIDAETKARLEKKIIAFRDKTNPRIEIAVAVVKTTGDRPIFEYALAVARGWGIGTRADDNPGALLLVAVDDRKYFTQVSKDLEDELTDGLVGSLQRSYLVPEFKRGNYAKGIEDTIDAYVRTIEERKSGAPAGVTNDQSGGSEGINDSKDGSICGLLVCLIVIGIIVFIIVAQSRSKSGPDKNDKDRWGGGGFGGSGGGSGKGAEIAGDILGAILAGLASGGGSSSSGSSSSWGGSSGGGSWGGFGGGGDFGGGGAGGGW